MRRANNTFTTGRSGTYLTPTGVGLVLVFALCGFGSDTGGRTGAAAGRAESESERRIGALMEGDRGQRRGSFTRNDTLALVARRRAEDMGRRRYFGHVTPDGHGPNRLVEDAGYVLPDYYGKHRTANNVESISAGQDTAEDAWDGWMESSGHREHILGLTPFYAEQTEYGVGHAFVPGSRYGHYWVIITAKPGP